jgi:hypothetical protein
MEAATTLAPHVDQPVAPHVDQLIAATAHGQRGLVTYPQLVEIGLSGAAVAKRVDAGRLHRIHPGVYAVGHQALDHEALVMAAILWSNDGCAAGRCAARLWRIYDRGRPSVEILSARRHRPLDTVVVRYGRHVPERDVTVLRGLRITTPERTIAELSEDLSRHQLAFAMHELRRRRLAGRESIARIVREHPHRRGHPAMVAALALHDAGSAGTFSGAEDRALELLADAGFPEPLVNVRMRLGRWQPRIDLRWPELRLGVEIDGPEHRLPARRIRDRELDAAMRRAGYVLIRIPVAFVEGIVEILADRFDLRP